MHLLQFYGRRFLFFDRVRNPILPNCRISTAIADFFSNAARLLWLRILPLSSFCPAVLHACFCHFFSTRLPSCLINPSLSVVRRPCNSALLTGFPLLQKAANTLEKLFSSCSACSHPVPAVMRRFVLSVAHYSIGSPMSCKASSAAGIRRGYDATG
jgi:hypothetical protein